MDVMILESVPPILRGEFSRWLTPIGGGVHVGQISAYVRDHLWSMATSKVGSGRAIQIWSCRGEPGYSMRVCGLQGAELIDLEGIPMIAIKDAAWREAIERFTDRPVGGMVEGALGDLATSQRPKTQ